MCHGTPLVIASAGRNEIILPELRSSHVNIKSRNGSSVVSDLKYFRNCRTNSGSLCCEKTSERVRCVFGQHAESPLTIGCGGFT